MADSANSPHKIFLVKWLNMTQLHFSVIDKTVYSSINMSSPVLCDSTLPVNIQSPG